MKHIISALVENKPGVLAHVAGMFAARAFNIDSLVVGRTEDPQLSRMTIVVVGDDRVVEQVRKQLAKVVPVVKVQDFAGQPVVARDLMLITISLPSIVSSRGASGDVSTGGVMPTGLRNL